MKQLIERRLRNTQPPANLVTAALARLPVGITADWFSRPLVPAAVLIALIERNSGLTVLLTQRTEHLDDHPGQISFPGGRCDDTDEGPCHTALRETQEEVGVAAESVEVVGYLDPLPVITGFAVMPVVGFVSGDPELVRFAWDVGVGNSTGIGFGALR